jgi:YspA, cpYpsA-related SLOG family
MLEPEIAALDDGAVDHLGVFVEPSLVLLRTARNDHDVARAADLLFGAEAELHLALEHPNDLLICVTVAMKVLVCGGRNFRSPAQVFRALDRLHQEKPITELMQGGATGANQFAMEWAATKPEIKRYACHADWETHGARQDRSETRRC